MSRSRLRLAIAAALFVGWLGWLVYLAATGTDDVVLSRPQFLVANVHVRATLRGDAKAPNAEATVQEVFWATGGKEKLLTAGTKITVANLPECGPDQGWAGPGDYILALMTGTTGTKVTTYQVAPTPRTPGYPGAKMLPRIYPDTPSRRRQLKQIEASYD